MRRFVVGLFLGCGIIWAVTRLNSSQIVNLPSGGQLAVGWGLIVSANAPAVNPVLIPTHDSEHANENYCASANGTTAYSCKLPQKALTAYSAGEMFLLNVDSTCATTCSVDVDSLGAKSLTKADGITAPGGSLISGQSKLIWYDGSVFRLMY